MAGIVSRKCYAPLYKHHSLLIPYRFLTDSCKGECEVSSQKNLVTSLLPNHHSQGHFYLQFYVWNIFKSSSVLFIFGVLDHPRGRTCSLFKVCVSPPCVHLRINWGTLKSSGAQFLHQILKVVPSTNIFVMLPGWNRCASKDWEPPFWIYLYLNWDMFLSIKSIQMVEF